MDATYTERALLGALLLENQLWPQVSYQAMTSRYRATRSSSERSPIC